MIAGLEEVDAVVSDKINQPVLLGQSPRPDPGSQVFQGFRFAPAFEGISHDGLDKRERPQSGFPVGLDPPADVFPEFALEHGIPSPGSHARLFSQVPDPS